MLLHHPTTSHWERQCPPTTTGKFRLDIAKPEQMCYTRVGRHFVCPQCIEYVLSVEAMHAGRSQ